jgi:hypothetical protein
MSRHQAYRNYDYENDLDEYDGGAELEEEEEGLSAEDKGMPLRLKVAELDCAAPIKRLHNANAPQRKWKRPLLMFAVFLERRPRKSQRRKYKKPFGTTTMTSTSRSSISLASSSIHPLPNPPRAHQ